MKLLCKHAFWSINMTPVIHSMQGDFIIWQEKKKRSVNLESSKINSVFNYNDYLSLNMYPQEYLPLITTCHPIQSFNCSNKEKPRLRSFVQPKITKPARIEWIWFSLIPALFVSFRCIGRGQNAVCPEKLGNWQLTTGKHKPRRPFSGKLITSIFCYVDKKM